MFLELSSHPDIQWLKDTHLKGIPLPSKWANFKVAVLQVTLDKPYAVSLFLSERPTFADDFYRIRFINNPPIYAECEEYNGKTNEMKRLEHVTTSRIFP